MPCDPSNNNIGVGGIPAISLPGFGLPFAPITVPAPGFELPEGFPESILELLNNLTVNWPGLGKVVPYLDDITNTILKALSNMFSQIAPFLSLYNFFMAMLNMVLCIIEVLCAIPNPWSTMRAIVRLVKNCLPPFLNLFPWIALLSMILSLIALFIALILYIVSRILAFIEDLLRNLQVLIDGLSFSDGESTAAAIMKIASLLCLMDNLIAIFSSLAAIIAIVESLANISGRTVCGSSQCCTEDVCPPFISENPDGIQGSKGKLIYHNAVHDIGASFGAGSFDRAETWQFVNDDVNQAENSKFRKIITPQLGPSDFMTPFGFEYGDIFWPEGQIFSKDTTLRRAPYLVDLVLENYNTGTVTGSSGITKDFVIKNAIVNIKPYIGVYEYDNDRTVQRFDGYSTLNNTGTLRLVGGLVYELDEEGNEIPYLIDDEQATLETFLSKNETSSEPTSEDGYVITDITFNLKINHAALIYYDLIVYGCIPTVRQELDLANSVNGDVSAALEKIGSIDGRVLPDVTSTVACFNTAISKLRSNITLDTVESFQADILACSDSFVSEAEGIYCSVLFAGIDPFSCDVSLTPDAQFVSKEIKVEVTLRDKNGIDITQNIPDSCISGLIEATDIQATFGELSDVIYEDNKFVATITSNFGGSGTVTVTFNGNSISRVTNADTLDSATAIEPLQIPYEFVGIRARNPSVAEPDEKPRRDSGDVSRGD